jgi:hypothetical protein
MRLPEYTNHYLRVEHDTSRALLLASLLDEDRDVPAGSRLEVRKWTIG